MTIGERNRKIWDAIKKGDLTVSDLISDGGYLPTEQELRFLLKVYESTPFLNAVRRVDMTAPKRRINKIGIAGNFLNVAPTSGEALAADKRSKVFTEYVEMTTTELIGSMYIPYDVIEDNIERGALEDTIMDNILPQKVGRDLEKVIIQGDTNSADNLLKAFDGYLVLQTDSGKNLVDFTATSGVIEDDTYEYILEELPWEYRELHTALNYMQHYSHWDAYVRYRRANRAFTEGEMVRNLDHLLTDGFRGIPMMNTSRIPQANMLLTVPNNLILGVQRGIQFETARDIEARVIIIVVTMRVAVAIEENEAVVLASGLNPSGTSTS
jgi:hypothetical protein